ncbi:DUF7139 domain-containing protein [Natrarchaeobaculum aegyptiacum]|uniref:Permease n=1 Tax=Natrarchaeobaculum aegyptiacum TaxID=745377 RepID=A0A2Z2HW63_9EURY|nr:permease [Natrarchaeobaculum aegyptiacum]ARS91559.1 permease [Natrarchaeobaculum aegyptiacum]
MAADSLENGRLFALYRRYIGEPEDRTDVYLGFSLFLGGIGLAVVALALFLWSATLETHTDAYYASVRPAYALVMAALPITMLGIVVLLPADRKVRYTSMAGVVLTIVAAAGFVYAYPEDWYFHGQDYTLEVVVTYAVGVAGVTASTGAALIAHYLELARSVDVIESADESDADAEEEAESYTDEEIRRDIDAAMDGVELSWGGVEKSDNTQLQFETHEFDDVNVDVTAKTTRSSGVDEQVAGLKGLKGGEKKKTTSSESVEDQTAKLRELRTQRMAEEGPDGAELESGAETEEGLLETLRNRVRSLLGRN